MAKKTRNFLTLNDLSLAEHHALFARTRDLKQSRKQRKQETTLSGRTLVLILEKASTRTRLSFEAAMFQLGGHAMTLTTAGSQLGRGESLSDTARVISGYADGIVMRTFADQRLAELASVATVPVINGLTDGGHPVQLLADLFTVQERLGNGTWSFEGMTIAWVGDGASNMARSWMEAAGIFGFKLRVASPDGFRPTQADVAAAKGQVSVVASPEDAVKGADVINTDVWTSMGQETENAKRMEVFKPYTVTSQLVARAASHSIVLHCLPAHRGEEITADVLEGPRSAVFDEAENRLHTQKALLELLLLS